MGQVTIYIDSGTEHKLNAIVAGKGISKSKWIADLIRKKTATSWPEHVVQLAGAWTDLPTSDEIRQDMGQDVARERL